MHEKIMYRYCVILANLFYIHFIVLIRPIFISLCGVFYIVSYHTTGLNDCINIDHARILEKILG